MRKKKFKVSDSMGTLEIPASALYQAQTQRALDNFKFSSLHLPMEMIQALARIKQACAEVNQKWQALELDMFPLLKENELVSVLENMEELGGLLWNLVYKQSRIEKSLALAGIDFSDIQTLFDPALVRINNA